MLFLFVSRCVAGPSFVERSRIGTSFPLLSAQKWVSRLSLYFLSLLALSIFVWLCDIHVYISWYFDVFPFHIRCVLMSSPCFVVIFVKICSDAVTVFVWIYLNVFVWCHLCVFVGCRPNDVGAISLQIPMIRARAWASYVRLYNPPPPTHRSSYDDWAIWQGMKQGITTKTKRMKIMSMKNLIVIITKVIMRMTMKIFTWRLVRLAKVSFSMERSRLLCRCSSTSLLRLANSDPCNSDDNQHYLHWWSAWSALLWSLLCRCSSTSTLRLASFDPFRSTFSNINLNYCQLIIRL